jgi:hypothetical protein
MAAEDLRRGRGDLARIDGAWRSSWPAPRSRSAGEGDVTALSAYVIKTRAALAEQSLDALLQGDVTWPNP